MEENHHHIARQFFDLHLKGKADAFEFQQRLTRLYWDEIVPALTRLFDDLVGPHELIRIEKLEIDLGEITMRELERLIVEKIIQAIKDQLEKELAGLSFGPARMETTYSYFQAWVQYLETGRLAWQLSGLEERILLRAVLETIAAHRKAVDLFRAVLRGYPQAVRRLVLQHDEVFLHTLSGAVMGKKQEDLVALRRELQTILLEEQPAGLQNFLPREIVLQKGKLRAEYWIWLFQQWIIENTKRNVQEVTRVFLKALVPQKKYLSFERVLLGLIRRGKDQFPILSGVVFAEVSGISESPVGKEKEESVQIEERTSARETELESTTGLSDHKEDEINQKDGDVKTDKGIQLKKIDQESHPSEAAAEAGGQQKSHVEESLQGGETSKPEQKQQPGPESGDAGLRSSPEETKKGSRQEKSKDETPIQGRKEKISEKDEPEYMAKEATQSITNPDERIDETVSQSQEEERPPVPAERQTTGKDQQAESEAGSGMEFSPAPSDGEAPIVSIDGPAERKDATIDPAIDEQAEEGKREGLSPETHPKTEKKKENKEATASIDEKQGQGKEPVLREEKAEDSDLNAKQQQQDEYSVPKDTSQDVGSAVETDQTEKSADEKAVQKRKSVSETEEAKQKAGSGQIEASSPEADPTSVQQQKATELKSDKEETRLEKEDKTPKRTDQKQTKKEARKKRKANPDPGVQDSIQPGGEKEGLRDRISSPDEPEIEMPSAKKEKQPAKVKQKAAGKHPEKEETEVLPGHRKETESPQKESESPDKVMDGNGAKKETQYPAALKPLEQIEPEKTTPEEEKGMDSKQARERNREEEADAGIHSGEKSLVTSQSEGWNYPVREVPVGTVYYIRNAGVILLHPFLAAFFRELKLVERAEFVDESARHKAIHLIQYLATKETGLPEYELLLPKFLCDLHFEIPIEREVEISDAEKEEVENLLGAAIKHWGALGSASPDGMREGFLQRDGKLEKRENGWYLMVQQKNLDILLNRLPWNLSMVRLPWMKEMLRVEWA